MGRRDRGVKEKASMARSELVATVAEILSDMQQGLYQRALQLREQNTRDIDTLEEFRSFFTPDDENKPELHGGFANCHYSEDAAVHDLLKELKVTIRCVPLEENNEQGKCFLTGKPSSRRALFAKAY